MTAETLTPRKLLHSVLLSKGRMEALTDGIFAISMTLLVLELKAPDLPKNVASVVLLSKLGEEMPVFFSFLVSFLYCGLLWLLHHLAMHFIKHLQVALVWLNLLFLMTVAVLPFSCALLGHFLRNPAAQEIYFGNMLAAALLLALQWMFAKSRRLINEDDPRAAKAMQQRIMMFPVAMAAGMAVTPYRPMAGFWAMAMVLIALRVWQRKRFPAAATNPAQTSS